MSAIRQLAGQTLIYGLSSIVGRFLNYLLVPLYTYQFAAESYGIVTELYAYAAFLLVVFTYGLETAFFRFYEERKQDTTVFSTALLSITSTTVILGGMLWLLANPIADALYLSSHADFIRWFVLILCFDTLTALPFALLRARNQPMQFAAIKLVNIGLNIGLNLFFLVLCPYLLAAESWSFLHAPIAWLYNPEMGIGYIFISNLIASAATFLLLLPLWRNVSLTFDTVLWRKMMVYALPLILVGLAGIVNETLDRILLKFLLPGTPADNQAQIGIYGACYKLSILMTLFIQAYRYAAEPFFFARARQADAGNTYATTLQAFTLAGSLIFLGVMLYLDILKFFIGPAFHEGLLVVPILLMANLLLGVYYNLSVWYKLSDKTSLGAWVAISGALVTILLNWWWIPIMGYAGAAWATLVCYGWMTIISWWMGQRHYPIDYPILTLVVYLAGALALYGLFWWIQHTWSPQSTIKYGLATLLFLLYAAATIIPFRHKLRQVKVSN